MADKLARVTVEMLVLASVAELVETLVQLLAARSAAGKVEASVDEKAKESVS